MLWNGTSLRGASGLLAALTLLSPLGAQTPPATQPAPILRPGYTLGANDQILIRAPQAEEIDQKPFRIDAEGFLTLPVVGRIRAAGLTVEALEAELTKRLAEFVRNPQVAISLVQFRSDPVFFVGAFKNPGIYPLQGNRTLVEMLTAVGGLLPNANRRIRVSRRSEYGRIDLPGAVDNPERKISYVEISLESLTQDINPAADIVLEPYDIISVDRAERIYVSGSVVRAGAIELAERESVSVAQALTEAGGLTPTASQKIRVLRPVLGTSRRAEIILDLKRIERGEEVDFPLQPNDVVMVPRAGGRALLAGLATAGVTAIPAVAVALILRP
jgi:polysaccharide export outer membrane protein